MILDDEDYKRIERGSPGPIGWVAAALVAFVVLVGLFASPGAQSKPVAGMGDPTAAFIVLGDDTVEFCPPEAYLAIGRDVAGVNYYGCWRFKPEDKDTVQILWSQEPDTIIELPTNLFEKIPETKELKA